MERITHRLTPRLAAALLPLLMVALAAVPAAADAGSAGEKEKEVKREVRVMRLGDGELLRAPRGYLGVHLLTLTPELRAHFGVPEDAGALVASVAAGSPAEKAGIKVGDILTRIDGEPVGGPHAIRMQLRDADEGDTAAIELYRGGKAMNVTATLEKRERSEVDLAPMFKWDGKDGEQMVLRLDPEKMGEHMQKMEAFEMALPLGEHPQLINLRGREKELEKRLAELEKRIKELEKQLQR